MIVSILDLFCLFSIKWTNFLFKSVHCWHFNQKRLIYINFYQELVDFNRKLTLLFNRNPNLLESKSESSAIRFLAPNRLSLVSALLCTFSIEKCLKIGTRPYCVYTYSGDLKTKHQKNEKMKKMCTLIVRDSSPSKG